MTTGGKPRLLGISKRGNKYLRKLLVHGARAALPSLSASATALGKWLKSLLERAHKNIVIVALANKLARGSLGGAASRRNIRRRRNENGVSDIGRTRWRRERPAKSVGGESEMA